MNNNGTIADLGILSNIAYEDYVKDLYIGKLLTEDKERNQLSISYKVIDMGIYPISGMEALLLQNQSTGEFVIAYRGTQEKIDIVVDAVIGINNYNAQYEDAEQFVLDMLAKHQNIGLTKDNLTLTGHSLGGILTQAVGASLQIKGYAYNPFGVEKLLTMPDIPISGTVVIDFVLGVMETAIYHVLNAFGLESENAQWAKDHILNLSYFDEGVINGDILSNFASTIGSDHVGSVLPIFGENVGLGDGHGIPNFNSAIAEYVKILKCFSSDTTLRELSKAYALNGYDETNTLFSTIDIYSKKDLKFEFHTQKTASELISYDKADFYSLLHLIPFSIKGNISEYDSINPYDYSEEYISDRAEFLYYKIHPGEGTDQATEYSDRERPIETAYNKEDGFYVRKVIFGSDDGETDLYGTSYDDKIYGNDGNDEILGNAGADYIEGGLGGDTIDGGYGDDIIYTNANIEEQYDKETESDTNTVHAGSGDDEVYGSEGVDKLYGENDDDVLEGRGGDDTLVGGEGMDLMLGGAGNDTFIVEGSDESCDLFDGGADVDKIVGGDGDDVIRLHDFGSAHSIEMIDGKGGSNRIEGTDMGDVIDLKDTEVTHIESIKTGDGDDDIRLGNNTIRVDGGDGHDNICGTAGDDFLYGDKGADVLIGGLGNDTLSGLDENGDDDHTEQINSTIIGNLEDNLINYLAGNIGRDEWIFGGDYLAGGSGLDTYKIGSGDIIEDSDGEGEIYYDGVVQEYHDIDVNYIETVEDDHGTFKLYKGLKDGRTVFFQYDIENENLYGAHNGIGFNFMIRNFVNGDFGIRLFTEDGSSLDPDVADERNIANNECVFLEELESFESIVMEGTNDADNLIGSNESDEIQGHGGDDKIYGGEEDDLIFGEAGDDKIFGSSWNYDDAGNDEIYGGLGNDQLFGGAGVDNLHGDEGEDILEGGTGDDLLFGGDDNDTLSGGEDNDQLQGGDGVDSLEGEAGEDVLYGQGGNDDIDGGTGDDQLYGGLDDDVLRGGDGNDLIFGDSWDQSGAGNDELYGGTGDDELQGNGGDDILNGETGADVLGGQDGEDTLNGGDGNDTLFGGNDNDTLSGDADDDLLLGDAGNDYLDGGEGNDELQGGEGVDILSGGDGDDRLFGEDGEDVLNGGAGDDVLVGEGGNDRLNGGSGNDTYFVEAGDVITGDSDGSVIYNEQRLTGGYARLDGDNVFVSQDGLFIYEYNNGTLRINDQVTIENFSNGDLGIRLDVGQWLYDPRFPQYSHSRIFCQTDPLVLDLNHNGRIDFEDIDGSNVYFDMDEDGFAEKSGWISASDGFLVYDKNENGIVDDIGELFGSNFTNGFAVLEDLDGTVDGNDDGKISADDNFYQNLQVWQDLNQDGATQDGELKGLEELGITELHLEHGDPWLDNNDNIIMGSGTYVQNGETHLLADVLLENNNAHTIDNELHSQQKDVSDVLSDDTHLLPWLRGYGNISDLNLAYERNLELKKLAQEMVENGIGFTVQNFDRFMADWAGFDGNSDQPLDVWGKLWILEASVGSTEYQSVRAQGAFGITFDIDYIEFAYAEMRQHYLSGFITQAFHQRYLEGIGYSMNHNRLFLFDENAFIQSLTAYINSTPSKSDTLMITDLFLTLQNNYQLDEGRVLSSLNENEAADIFKNVISFGYDNVGANQSEYHSDNGSGYIYGTTGDDRLYGNTVSDYFDGNSGNDLLVGNSGDDYYQFGKGMGQDTIVEITDDDNDRILMDSTVTPDEIEIIGDSDSIYLKISGTNDVLKIENWYSGQQVEFVEFTDGTVWDAAFLEANATIAEPTEGDDVLSGTLDGEQIDGLAGNDQIYGRAGNDTLIGNAGNDVLSGDTGSDIYYFEVGFGQDVINNNDESDSVDAIEFSLNISSEMIQVTRVVDDLILSVTDSEDQITVSDYFVDIEASASKAVDEIRFADGTVWGVADVMEMSLEPTDNHDVLQGFDSDDVISGIGGDDELYGNAGDDWLTGGTGDDSLNGGFGEDTYFFDLGFGQDTINDRRPVNHLEIIDPNDYTTVAEYMEALDNSGYNSDIIPNSEELTVINHIKFGDGVLPNSIIVNRKYSNLILTIKETEDQLTVKGFFEDENFIIHFSDGTTWDFDKLKELSLMGTAADDNIIGFKSDDIISGLGGDDTLSGESGDDVLNGGAGNDVLDGGDGNDILDGGDGNDIFGGGNGHDVFIGGAGDDRYEDIYGGDTYHIGLGCGHDIIEDYRGVDSIVFGAGITMENLEFSVQRTLSYDLDLVITFRNSLNADNQNPVDSITIKGWFDRDSTIEKLIFSDTGEITTPEDIYPLLITDDDDLIQIFSEGGSVDALDGDDTVVGSMNDDVIAGNKGNDILEGRVGDDTYIFNRGDGKDTIIEQMGSDSIVFGEGIRKEHLVFRFDVDTEYRTLDYDWSDFKTKFFIENNETHHIHIGIKGLDETDTDFDELTDVITVENGLLTSGKIEKFEFTETDEVLTIGDLYQLMATDGNDVIKGYAGDSAIISGGLGNDLLYGNMGDDHLDGGAGNDVMEGGLGDDIYLFGQGDGKDIVFDAFKKGPQYERFLNGEYLFTHRYRWYYPAGDDRIQFREGVGEDDLIIRTSGNDLLIGLKEDEKTFEELSDVLTIKDFHITKIEHFEFYNGSVLSAQEIVGRLFTQYDDTVILDTGMDTKWTPSWVGDGFFKSYISDSQEYFQHEDYTPDHTVHALGGDDTVITAAGDDTIYAGEGNDTIDAGSGDNLVYGGTGDDTITGGGVLYGEEGNDTIEGASSADTIYAGTGDDFVSGGNGGDHYHYEIGDGSDQIDDLGYGNRMSWNDDGSVIDYRGIRTADGTFNVQEDQLIFGAGISKDNVQIEWGGNHTGYYKDGAYIGTSWQSGAEYEDHRKDIYVQVGSEQILISNWFNGEGKIEALVFEDGTSISVQNVIDSFFSETDDALDVSGSTDGHIYHVGSGDDVLHSGDGWDAIYAGSGDDVIEANAGYDMIYGGLGNDHIDGGDDGDQIYGEAGNDILIGGGREDILYGGEGDDVLHGDSGDDSLSGGAGADELNGGVGYDYLSGGDGADILNAGDGDDVLVGGTSSVQNDELYGGKGDDHYIYNRGDGRDVILDESMILTWQSEFDRFGNYQSGHKEVYESAGTDTLQFGEGITADDLLFFWKYETDENGNSVDRDRNIDSADLIIALKDPDHPDATIEELTDVITIRDFFRREEIALTDNYATEEYEDWYYDMYGDPSCDIPSFEYVSMVEIFKFSDDTEISGHQLIEALQTERDDRIEAFYNDHTVMYGLGGNDVLRGFDGNDDLYGGEGNDRLEGGYGTNALEGGAGDDVYVLTAENLPDWDNRKANDVIIDQQGVNKVLFLNDVAREDIIFTKDGDDIVVYYGLELQHKVGIEGNTVEQFEMTDGSVITKIEVLNSIETIATELKKDGNDVTRWDIFNNIECKEIQYNSWTDGFVEHEGYSWANQFQGNTENEIVTGGDENDELIGNSGDDVLHGGRDDDYLNAGNGNDIYLFERGDQNDHILDKQERIYVNDSGSNSGPGPVEPMSRELDGDDSSGYGSSSSECSWSYMPNEAPSDDTLILKNDIEISDLEAYWMIDSRGDSNDLLLRVNPNDESAFWIDRDQLIDRIVARYENVTLTDVDLARNGGDDPYLTAADLAPYSDKALREFNYRETVRNSYSEISEMLTWYGNLAIAFRQYERNDDTVEIEGYYNPEYRIENMYLEGSDDYIDNNDLMDLMSTDNSDSVRGVDWADNTIEAQGGHDLIVGGVLDDDITGGEDSDYIHGRDGDDTYHFNEGDGRDIVFDGDISVETIVNSSESWLGLDHWYNEYALYYPSTDTDRLSVEEMADSSDIADVGGDDHIVFGDDVHIQDIMLAKAWPYYDHGLYIGYGDMVDADIDDGLQEYAIDQGDASDFNFITGDNSNAYGSVQQVYANEIILPVQFYEGASIESFVTDGGSHIKWSEVTGGWLQSQQYINENSEYLQTIQNNGRDARGYVDQLMLNQWHRVDKDILGTDGADTIFSGDGDDIVFAGGGDDVIEGGFGTDMLEGGSGDDTFIYNRWDGSDTIVDAGGHDTLIFGEDLLLTDFIASISCDTGDLVLGVIDEVEKLKAEAAGATYAPDPMDLSQKVIIRNFGDENLRVDRFVFSDGTEMTATELHEYFLNLQGSDIICDAVIKTEDYDLMLDEDTSLNGNIAVANGAGSLVYGIDTDCIDGVFILNDDGSWVYTPTANFNGNDSVVVKITDANGTEVLSTIDLTINPINDLPEVVDPDHNILKNIRVVAGSIEASDIDGDTLFYHVSNPEHGTLSIDANGNWEYTADDLYVGTDSAIVTVDDGNGGVVTTTLNFDIQVSAPVINDTGHALDEDTFMTAGVLVSNPIGGELTYTLVDTTDNGEFNFNADGTWNYTPVANYNGPDTFTITVTNSYGLSTTEIIQISVNPVNDAPEVLDSDPYVLLGGTSISNQVEASDIDGDVLQYNVQNGPENGELAIDENGNWTYVPTDGFTGYDSAVVLVDDGNGGAVSTELDFKVNIYDGGDIVVDDGPDAIKLEGVGTCDLSLDRSGNHLIVNIENKGTITFTDYFINPAKGVDYLITDLGPVNLAYDEMSGQSCWDLFSCNDTTSVLEYGTCWGDRLTGTAANDVLFGAGGNDRLYGCDGNDTLVGGSWNDKLYGDDGNDTLLGDSGNDYLIGGKGNDALIGGTGNDYLCANDGDDVLCGGEGNDRLHGESGNDMLYGDEGRDNLYGGLGNDYMSGGSDHDLLYGDDGDDILIGDTGKDLLKGGNGGDQYLFEQGDGNDQIKDSNKTKYTKWCTPETDGSVDEVLFGESISLTDVAFYKHCGNLYVQYGTDDMLKIHDQNRDSGRIERFELSDGKYMTHDDINILIQEMSAFACDHGIDFNSAAAVRNNDELMNIVMNSWK